LGFLAVACSSVNVFGGFLITDRMLRMFREGKGDAGKRSPFSLERIMVPLATLICVAALGLSLWFIYQDPKHARSVLTYLYILSAVLFILGLKGLSSPRYARGGMLLAALGMAVAIIGTLFHEDIQRAGYIWIGVGMTIGAIVGGAMGLQIPMTAVPQRTALSHSLGALAATLVGIAEYCYSPAVFNPEFPNEHPLTHVKMTALGFEVVIGALTFTGSLMAAAKLQELLRGSPITYKGQNIWNFLLVAVLVASFVGLVYNPELWYIFALLIILALAFGFLLVLPIGAADMPVVIALLNSYAGLADAAMGFVLANRIQIITGSLDGASGFLLSLLMCRAMNRSAFNVLFGAFGQVQETTTTQEAKGTVRSITAEELAVLFDGARSVIIVPGYGMAVAQAQHGISELAKLLGAKGVDVKYAIHPVAGRMPGHMNVLLAEANVPYDQLYEMDQINPYFPETDIVLIVGANDVTNPAAKNNKSSPLYGMPILEVDRAKSIIVMKRSMRPGFAGVDNELYYDHKCMMLFGDAKDSANKLIAALKS
jgi:NAD(P) transhydrogenase subunit beta